MLTSEREKEIRCIVDTPSPLTSWHRYTQAIRDLLAEIGELRGELGDAEDQVAALMADWGVEPHSFYDEEGVEGWTWTDPDGVEHNELGDWGQTPPWPESARAALGRRPL